jgi:hypothetical protein
VTPGVGAALPRSSPATSERAAARLPLADVPDGMLFEVSRDQSALTVGTETRLKLRVPLGGLDEWFKSHAWKACLG